MTETYEVFIPVKLQADDVAEAAMMAQRIKVMLDGQILTTVSEVRIVEDADEVKTIINGRDGGEQP